MWRDFNRRLSRVFGRKGGGAGGGGCRTTAVARASAWASSIGVLIAIYLGSGVFVVQDGQAGVVMQFGNRGTPAVRVCIGVAVSVSKPHEFVNIGADPPGGDRSQQRACVSRM